MRHSDLPSLHGRFLSWIHFDAFSFAPLTPANVVSVFSSGLAQCDNPKEYQHCIGQRLISNRTFSADSSGTIVATAASTQNCSRRIGLWFAPFQDLKSQMVACTAARNKGFKIANRAKRACNPNLVTQKKICPIGILTASPFCATRPNGMTNADFCPGVLAVAI